MFSQVWTHYLDLVCIVQITSNTYYWHPHSSLFLGSLSPPGDTTIFFCFGCVFILRSGSWIYLGCLFGINLGVWWSALWGLVNVVV